MAIDPNDAAYHFVQQANQKETQNAHIRAERELARKQPRSPLFWLAIAALMGGIMYIQISEGNRLTAIMNACLIGFALVMAYQSRKHRRAT